MYIDTRNTYEIDIGTFEGAVNPNCISFRDFPSYVQTTLNPTVHKKVAMFCTGGESNVISNVSVKSCLILVR